MRPNWLPQCLSIALAGIAATAVAACSGSPSSPAPATGAATTGASEPTAAHGTVPAASASNGEVPSASASYCTAAPSSLVHSTLGLTVGKQLPIVQGPVVVCAYAGRYEVLVRYQINESAGQFGQDRKSAVSLHQSVTTVNDLGNAAFSAMAPGTSPASTTLAARKGTVAIFITSPASVAAERTLMTRLLAQV